MNVNRVMELFSYSHVTADVLQRNIQGPVYVLSAFIQTFDTIPRSIPQRIALSSCGTAGQAKCQSAQCYSGLLYKFLRVF